MDVLAAGFWGGYFGTVALMMAGSIAAFARSLHRVALTAFLFGLISALFAAAWLGWPGMEDDAQRRWVAAVTIGSGSVLGLMMLAMLGLLRHPATARQVRGGVALLTLAIFAGGWFMPPAQALVTASALTLLMAVAVLIVCVRSAQRGDRLAWSAVLGVCFMIVFVGGLDLIGLRSSPSPWWLHAATAVCGMAYVSVMATALWLRYSYLIELREVVEHGPSYDPITRMRTHSQTGQMVGMAFFGNGRDERPMGVIAISIGNLQALENLHGRAAMNHALFLCANRLRRCVPTHVETGRLGEDGFLLLVRQHADAEYLAALARVVAERLARPVALSTSAAPADLEAGSAHWVAQVGVGVVSATPQLRPSEAIASARDLSRSAWAYAGRVAFRHESTGQIAELPAAG